MQHNILFFRLFDTGIPLRVFAVAVLVAACGHLLLYFKCKRHVLLPWIMACLYLMLYTTVLRRSAHGGCHLRLEPLWSLDLIRAGSVEVLYEKIYNVLFFIPYGILLASYLLPAKGKKPSPLPFHKGTVSRMLMAVVIGFLTSASIEFLQLITRTGACETDDVICNTVGCVVGVILAVGFMRLLKGGSKKH